MIELSYITEQLFILVVVVLIVVLREVIEFLIVVIDQINELVKQKFINWFAIKRQFLQY